MYQTPPIRLRDVHNREVMPENPARAHSAQTGLSGRVIILRACLLTGRNRDQCSRLCRRSRSNSTHRRIPGPSGDGPSGRNLISFGRFSGTTNCSFFEVMSSGRLRPSSARMAKLVDVRDLKESDLSVCPSDEMVDIRDLKSRDRKVVSVQVRPWAV